MLNENDKKNILNSLLETIQSIADVEYQKRAWIQGILPGTDFDETVNSYSLDGKGILEHYKDFGISEPQFQILRKFDNEFCDFYNKNDLPLVFIDTPEWIEITFKANEVLKSFNYQR